MQAFARSILPVINVLGYVVLIFAGTMLIPLAFAFGVGEPAEKDYDLALLITAGIGAALLLTTRRHRRELQPRDGFLLVTLGWTVLPACATLPLLFHLPGLSFTDAAVQEVAGIVLDEYLQQPGEAASDRALIAGLEEPLHRRLAGLALRLGRAVLLQPVGDALLVVNATQDVLGSWHQVRRGL